MPKPRVNLTRFHGVFAPNSKYRARVTPAKRGRGGRHAKPADTEEPTPAERRAATLCVVIDLQNGTEVASDWFSHLFRFSDPTLMLTSANRFRFDGEVTFFPFGFLAALAFATRFSRDVLAVCQGHSPFTLLDME